jgi:hypothetical protein
MIMWKEKVEETIQAIKDHDYYQEIWERVKHKKPLEECSKAELLEPFQDFWEELPDNLSIRREPFFQVCELAEEFCFGDD